jgi:hypothetical protein
VFASPIGKKLYERLGHKLVGFETAGVGGEAEMVDIFSLEKRS